MACSAGQRPGVGRRRRACAGHGRYRPAGSRVDGSCHTYSNEAWIIL